MLCVMLMSSAVFRGTVAYLTDQEKVLNTFCDLTGFTARKNMCDYYKVSRLCEFPSILFETAYMSNPKDLAYFMKDSNMDIAANAIAQGILEFFREQNN